jgi:glucose/arabinose dehydrogenase
MLRKPSIFLSLVLLVASGCKDSAQQSRAAEGTTVQDPSKPESYRVETIATHLEIPWAIAFSPDGRIFLTERPGRIRIIKDGKLLPEPMATITEVHSAGESGLMDLTLHPLFNQNHFLYIAYAYQGNGQSVRVARYTERNGQLIEPKTLLENIPAALYHAGTRVRFGPDGKLYITTGDAGKPELSQKLDSLSGKTLRLNEDGSVPKDNPFVSQASARPEIWSYGHRNSQGIAWKPGSGLMFQTEHGPSGSNGPGGGDEVNIVERGENYGWPIIHHRESQTGMHSPLLEYTPAIAPASALFYRGFIFPKYRDNFFFGCLRGEMIIRVVLEGRRVISQERLLEKKYGRIRDVEEGPDGAIYFSTSNRDGRGNPAAEDDRILRLVAVK